MTRRRLLPACGVMAWLALELVGAAARQPAPAAIRLIVKGDDMGAGHGINVATIDAYKRGVLTTTNVIVPGPWFPEAARLLAGNPGLDVGVHLALTSEWDNVKWRPLTHAPSLVDADGYFFPTVQPRPGAAAGRSIKESGWTIGEVERELRAQLDLARRHLPQATYTWNHMGFPSVSPEMAQLVSRLSREYRPAGTVGARRSVDRAGLREQGHGRRESGQAGGEARDARPGLVAAHRPRSYRRCGDAGVWPPRL